MTKPDFSCVETRFFSKSRHCASVLQTQVPKLCTVGAGTFVGEGMNTLRPTGLAAWNEAPVGTLLGGLGGVSNAIAI